MIKDTEHYEHVKEQISTLKKSLEHLSNSPWSQKFDINVHLKASDLLKKRIQQLEDQIKEYQERKGEENGK